jgi:predicted cupin superfamily sugar epimerase
MAEQIIQELALIPHPEGGFYRQTHKSEQQTSVPWSEKPRSLSTSIYFLLPKGHVSHLHRIKGEETWHFYKGGRIAVVMLRDDGVEEIILGNDISQGDKPQFLVPPDTWFGAYPLDGTEFGLVGCTVSPGFEFEDFELANRDNLLSIFPPSTHQIIHKLT